MHLSVPEGPGRFPGIVVIQHQWGVADDKNPSPEDMRKLDLELTHFNKNHDSIHTRTPPMPLWTIPVRAIAVMQMRLLGHELWSF